MKRRGINCLPCVAASKHRFATESRSCGQQFQHVRARLPPGTFASQHTVRLLVTARYGEENLSNRNFDGCSKRTLRELPAGNRKETARPNATRGRMKLPASGIAMSTMSPCTSSVALGIRIHFRCDPEDGQFPDTALGQRQQTFQARVPSETGIPDTGLFPLPLPNSET